MSSVRGISESSKLLLLTLQVDCRQTPLQHLRSVASARPVLSVLPLHLSSILPPFPWILILHDLWTDRFKGLDSGAEDYVLASSVWSAIGRASEAAGSSIPAAMGPRPFNGATDLVRWTADSRSFWTLYLAPTLLERRFKKEKYYQHFIDLVVLLNTCLKFDYTTHDVNAIRNGFVKWVDEYES
jgi:hypothetical protein